MRVADFSPGSIDAQRADESAIRRGRVERSARDSLALGRNVGAALRRGDYAGAMEDARDSTVAAMDTMPEVEHSPALLGVIEAHRPIVQTELADPTKPPPDWQEREAGLLPERLADPVGIYDDHGAYSATASYFGTFTAGFGDDTREASAVARAAVARVGDPAAQAAHAEREALHLAGQERPELIEQARRAMGLAVPSARPGKSTGHYPQAAANPAESNYGSGMEGMVGKGMVAYSGNTKATPEEIAEDFIVSARNGKPDSVLNVYQQKPEKDAQAGQVNARLMEASKKSAIVALGADPRNTFYTNEPAKAAVGGAYGRTLGGKMQANVHSPATAAHESMHNGMERLLKDPDLPSRFKKQLGNHEQQEFITRMLMLKHFGEAESEGEQSLGFKGNHPQIVKAREMLADPKWQQWSDDLEAFAARKVASDRPGGPR